MDREHGDGVKGVRCRLWQMEVCADGWAGSWEAGWCEGASVPERCSVNVSTRGRPRYRESTSVPGADLLWLWTVCGGAGWGLGEGLQVWRGESGREGISESLCTGEREGRWDWRSQCLPHSACYRNATAPDSRSYIQGRTPACARRRYM